MERSRVAFFAGKKVKRARSYCYTRFARGNNINNNINPSSFSSILCRHVDTADAERRFYGRHL